LYQGISRELLLLNTSKAAFLLLCLVSALLRKTNCPGKNIPCLCTGEDFTGCVGQALHPAVDPGGCDRDEKAVVLSWLSAPAL